MKRRFVVGGSLVIAAAVAFFVFRARENSQKISSEVRRIEIYKAARQLVAVDANGNLTTFRIALGFAPMAPKEREGDGRPPEGRYVVCVKNPRSKFHLSLGLNYPGPGDADRGLTAGLISATDHAEIHRAAEENRPPPWKTALGGEIFIHGGGAAFDWTQGCIALPNAQIEELFAHTAVGTPVEIFP